jgi:hypothetical protein
VGNEIAKWFVVAAHNGARNKRKPKTHAINGYYIYKQCTSRKL